MEQTPVDSLDQPFLDGAVVVGALLRVEKISRCWKQLSALPEMSVGALACHLSRQVSRAAELLVAHSSLPVLASVDEHYTRAAWVTATSLDDPANDRSADETEAELGHDRMLARFETDLVTATRYLRLGAAHDTVGIPWQGWSLRRNDFLHTRLLEIVVHSTDLAASIALPTPEFPDSAFSPVRDLLARLAVDRHGQAAVISTLTRRERASNISAF